jgi:hypothetical protein
MARTSASASELLAAIDAKLGALLALTVDKYLRETGVAKPKERSIDRLLSDVGLSTRDIATLLGKTERAVQLVLQDERERAEQAKAERKTKPKRERAKE